MTRDPLDVVLKQVTTVELGELTAAAGLMTRTDRKYLVPTAAFPPLLAALSQHLRVLQIGTRRRFGYESLYFDTPDHLCYRLSAYRRRRRFKIRTRTYLDTGDCFLEVKARDGRGRNMKARIDYEGINRGTFTAPAREFVREVVARHDCDTDALDQLQPVLAVRYRRATLLLPGPARATIDTDLTWRANTNGFGAGEVLVVETKSHGSPSMLDRALWQMGIRPRPISKFGIGMALHHPDLPSNKWSRLLRTELGKTVPEPAEPAEVGLVVAKSAEPRPTGIPCTQVLTH